MACGADQVTGLQGDCWPAQSANIAQANAQATAAASGMAVATATASMGYFGMGTSDKALPSCVNIGTDLNAWRLFHNPDKLVTTTREFHVSGETKVDMSDPTFAAISRAYMSASTSFYGQTIVQITDQTPGQFNFPYGGINTGTIGGTVVGGTSTTYVSGVTSASTCLLYTSDAADE